jgi:hypothetical protein
MNVASSGLRIPAAAMSMPIVPTILQIYSASPGSLRRQVPLRGAIPADIRQHITALLNTDNLKDMAVPSNKRLGQSSYFLSRGESGLYIIGGYAIKLEVMFRM